MKEPWGEFDWLAWRVYADALMEAGAPADAVKRAVKCALGLRQRPRLVLIGVEVAIADGGRRFVAFKRTSDFFSPANPVTVESLRWVTGPWALQQLLRTNRSGWAPDAMAEAYLTTPADFPGLVEAARPVHGREMVRMPWQSLVNDFYRKASEGVAVRCRKGEITIRKGRSARAPWAEWEG